MIEHLLVPLDGSRLAEAALPPAAALARLFSARITLMHVIEQDATDQVHGERHLTEAGEAAAYLQTLRSRLPADLRVDCHVHAPAVADVADGIAAHREELHPDIIVMCTHGPAGLGRLLKGSLAQQVVGLGKTPLLHLRAEAAADSFALRRLLVPLDGRREHEGGLDLALELAAAGSGVLHLLSVVPTLISLAGEQATLSRFMPAAARELQAIDSRNLRHYLEKLLARAKGREVAATAEIRQGNPVDLIVQSADDLAADLIVMATHGKAGGQAFWDNSMAVRVQGETLKPVLLVPVGEGVLSH